MRWMTHIHTRTHSDTPGLLSSPAVKPPSWHPSRCSSSSSMVQQCPSARCRRPVCSDKSEISWRARAPRPMLSWNNYRGPATRRRFCRSSTPAMKRMRSGSTNAEWAHTPKGDGYRVAANLESIKPWSTLTNLVLNFFALANSICNATHSSIVDRSVVAILNAEIIEDDMVVMHE